MTDQPSDGPSGQGEEAEAKAKRKLELDVHIKMSDLARSTSRLRSHDPRSSVSSRNRWVTFSADAQVPGFRPGRAPRQLVVKRFRKQVADQVKSALLMASLEQIDEDYKLNPIVQPKLDVEAIELPDDGPMTFEMEVEVRPEFEVAEYKGLKVKRPVKAIREQDVEAQLARFLERLRADRSQARGGGQDRRLSHGRPHVSEARR